VWVTNLLKQRLNDPTSACALDIAVNLASEITEPPDNSVDIARELEGLNNPTSVCALDIDHDLASEITEPPANLLGNGAALEGLNNPTSRRVWGGCRDAQLVN
jgi:hypothetical protein